MATPASDPKDLRRPATCLAKTGVCWGLALGLLLLAPAAGAQESDGCGASVTVSAGDTLTSLARRCGTSVGALMKANPGLRDPDLVPRGTVLTLPQSVAAKPAPPAAETGAGTLSVEPSTPAPGERVTVRASGLPPRARVWVKGGRSRLPEQHLVLRGARADAQGELRITLRLPKWVEAGPARFTLSVEVPRSGTALLSPPLDVSLPRAASKTE